MPKLKEGHAGKRPGEPEQRAEIWGQGPLKRQSWQGSVCRRFCQIAKGFRGQSIFWWGQSEKAVDNAYGLWYDNRAVADTPAALYGEMSERLKEPVLKTGEAQVSVGSNPTLSATFLSAYGSAEVPKWPKGLPC